VRLFVEFLKHKGNVTPLGEIRLTPEEELLHAVFGESRRSSASPFAIAAAEVVEQHGELLRRLAQ
jgi:hypothetical protein